MLDPKLDTLLLVAEKRNFTREAQALSLTQPAVSHHISQLEQELGVRLFVRGNGWRRSCRRRDGGSPGCASASPIRRRAALWQRYWPVTPMKTPVSP